MKKKILSMILCLCLIGVVVGCGNAGSREEAKASDASDSKVFITENYTLDGLLDLSEEGLLGGQKDSESLDTDSDIIVDDYLNASVESEDVEEDVPGEAVFTSTDGLAILFDAKLLKEQTRAKNKEELLNIINSEELTDEERQAAVDAMVQMTAIAEKETAAEILLGAKGFKVVVVSIDGDTADVILNEVALDKVMQAQIEDIVKRKTEIPQENIAISIDAQWIPGQAVSASVDAVFILSDAKLLKSQTRANNKEILLEIIHSREISDEQKQAAVEAMVQMTAIAEKEAAAEILLEAKGFDVVVSINGDTVDVVVNAAALDDVMRAQIEDIVSRKTQISAENIIISTVVQ